MPLGYGWFLRFKGVRALIINGLYPYRTKLFSTQRHRVTQSFTEILLFVDSVEVVLCER